MSLLGVLDRIADLPTFDKAMEPARKAVNALPQLVKDALHGTWLGHPLHPVLAQVPVGTWVSAGVLDLLPATRPAAAVLIGTGAPCPSPVRRVGRPSARSSSGPRSIQSVVSVRAVVAAWEAPEDWE